MCKIIRRMCHISQLLIPSLQNESFNLPQIKTFFLYFVFVLFFNFIFSLQTMLQKVSFNRYLIDFKAYTRYMYIKTPLSLHRLSSEHGLYVGLCQFSCDVSLSNLLWSMSFETPIFKHAAISYQLFQNTIYVLYTIYEVVYKIVL